MIRLLIPIAVAVFFLPGCKEVPPQLSDWMPGKPKESEKWAPPDSVTDFKTLYSQNCQACHGNAENPGPVISMNNPVYLEILPLGTLRDIISKGIPKTSMPAFSKENGGALTSEQVEIIARGILAGKGNADPAALPPYAAPPGSQTLGATTAGVYCASCHGADGTGVADKAGSIVNPSYLNLVSNQYLRSIVIAGRNDLGCPDFKSRLPGRIMSNEDIANVTAWLIDQRRNQFGKRIIPGQQ